MLKKTFLLACLCAPMAMADTIQQVSGIVVDADSGEPIIGAAVMVVNTTIGTITDIDGRFTLTDLPGKNGADCYSKNGHAVTVLTRQS